jgi:hypothetical protein
MGPVAVGRVRAAELDAVTLDAHGTLVRLEDPVPALLTVLAERGVERTPAAVLAGFRTEVAHYAPRASEGHDEASLAQLQQECAGVFLDAIDAELDPEEFAPAYVGALRFEVLPGVFVDVGGPHDAEPADLGRERDRASDLRLGPDHGLDDLLRRLIDDLVVVGLEPDPDLLRHAGPLFSYRATS